MSEKEFYIRDLVIDDEYGVIESVATIKDAAKKMKELGVPDLVVIDQNDKVLGVVADFDIVQDIIAEGKNPSETKVLDAMYTIDPVTQDTLVTDAFEKMRDLQVNVVPVIKKEKLIGVATIQDCWSFIPDQETDKVGLIPVSDPNNAEFWFASVCGILAFVLGILLPMIGVFGYFNVPANITGGTGIIGFDTGIVTFSIFEVGQAPDHMLPFVFIVGRNPIWVLMIINGFLLAIFGVIGLFSLFYTSFSDLRKIKTGNMVRFLPWLTIIFMVLEWILYLAVLAPLLQSSSVDIGGLLLSIFSILLILAAIFREYIFRQAGTPKSSIEEVAS
jgi:CBS domain-containing protein